jgi:polyisoprenoid-binding protein YceI
MELIKKIDQQKKIKQEKTTMSWKIDNVHSDIHFSVRHMMITNVRGRFERFTGEVDFDEQDYENSSVKVQIEAASINTREPQRDGHLKSPDFLDAEKYPYLTFASKKVEMLDASNGKIYGDLTIRDVTRPVVLDVEFAGITRNPYGMTIAGFTATTKINRKEWGLTWNVALETGGMLVGEDIKIEIELEIIQQAELETEAEPAAAD